MSKICFITASRAEYGLLRWIMQEVKESSVLELQIIVTGAHLLQQQGHTVEQIEGDGFIIDGTVDIALDVSSHETIAASMGRMAEQFAKVLGRLEPDYVAVLGDRYELLPIVDTAFVMRIPIIHFCGGDVTEGAIDDGIRNAVSMLAQYHFPGNADSAANIIRMRNDDKNVWMVGEPGLDYFDREKLMSRKELADNLCLDPGKDWCLFTYHPETKESLEYNLSTVESCLDIFECYNDLQIIATYSNADFGGRQINEYIERRALDRRNNMKIIPSLGNHRYLSIMKQIRMIVGNSSSGVVEAPFLGVPVVNIGNRQKGRHLCDNIIQTDACYSNIETAISLALIKGIAEPAVYWGDGHTAEKVIKIMERELT